MVGIGILGALLAAWANILLPQSGHLDRGAQDFMLLYLILTGVVVVIAAVFLLIGFWK
jgi:uncharacterized membrane protein